MKLKIVGSGGMYPLPNPFCNCALCEEARQKRGPYQRLGASLYVEDAKLLIDTPAEIAIACDRQDIRELAYISLSHKHPGYAPGLRIAELFGKNAAASGGTPVHLIALPEVIEDMEAASDGILGYYEKVLRCITVESSAHLCLRGIEISLLNNKTPGGNTTVYLLEEGKKKVIYAGVHCRPFQPDERFYDAHLLIIGPVAAEGPPPKDKETQAALQYGGIFSLEEVLELKERYRIKQVVITSIDERFGKSYGEYLRMEQKLKGVRYAYDGMSLKV